MSNHISIEDLTKVDIRLGQIIKVEDFPKARNPAWKLTINFGEEHGTKRSSAQITEYYGKKELQGRYVLCVTNLPPRQIADFMSECLTLGIYDTKGAVRLLGIDEADKDALPLGGKVC